MAQPYSQASTAANSRYSSALFGAPERSHLFADPVHYTAFNGGDIVPVYCREVLPNQTLSLSVDAVIRQLTPVTPTMGRLTGCLCAFWVPNRVINQSWVNVQGENTYDSWVAPEVTLAPLYTGTSPVQIPVGSVADYYGFPTQQPLPAEVLNACHDLKFRGYVSIYNNFFRDQNYQPPIPLPTLNIYQGFLGDGNDIPINGVTPLLSTNSSPSDGSFGAGAVNKAIYDNSAPSYHGTPTIIAARSRESRGSVVSFDATKPPLKANKLHDYFTSVLPAPQKGPTVFVPVSGKLGTEIPVLTSTRIGLGSGTPLVLRTGDGSNAAVGNLGADILGNLAASGGDPMTVGKGAFPVNLYTASGVNVSGLEIPLSNIREAAALQQYYECLARGGSRYQELVGSIFGVSVDDPFDSIPKCLGKEYFDLDLYQTAQTSASVSGDTPQGNLAAFGYTHSNRKLFDTFRFLEHGYLHVFFIVRHRNIYSSYLSRDNFRLNGLDFYTPFFANLSNQPVYTREINPFVTSSGQVFGYNEAWSEYRFEPDQVSGILRPGVSTSLAYWTYADPFDPALNIADGAWLQSNTASVVERTSAVSVSDSTPEFKGQFTFFVDKDLPMPTVSVPGMDII